MTSQVEDWVQRPDRRFDFPKFVYQITFKIHHELYGLLKHGEETCTNLRPKPYHFEKRNVPNSGTYTGWDDDKEV